MIRACKCSIRTRKIPLSSNGDDGYEYREEKDELEKKRCEEVRFDAQFRGQHAGEVRQRQLCFHPK